MLFNKDVTKMFESLTLFYQYINEKSGIMLSNQFIKETKDSCTDIECQSFCSEFSDSVRKCDDALEDPCEFAFDSLLNQGDQSEHILEQCQLDSGEMASERKSLSKCMQFSTLKMAEKISEIRSLQMANKILSGDVNILDSYRFEDS